MAREIQPVFELGKKVRGLKDWAAQTNVGGLSTERAVARAIGAPWSTFKTNIAKEQMSIANESALATAFGFGTDWVEWRDPDAIRTTAADQRRDTSKAFVERFLAFKSRAICLTIEAGLTQRHVDPRFADFSFSVAGSFEPTPQADDIPLLLSLSFDGRGWPLLLEGASDVLTVLLKGADLQLLHDRKGAKIEVVEIRCDGDAEGNFQGKVAGLGPWWTINVASGDEPWLAGRRRRNDGHDCSCKGFRVGDIIRAVMTARISDCLVRVADEPFEGVSDARKRFIEHLTKLDALKGAEAVLGIQILTVVEKS